MLQPKRLKYKKAKATRRFSWKDIIEFFVITCISWFISFVALYPVKQTYKWIVFSVLLVLLFILILPTHKNNCKIYELLIRMFKFKAMPKKYSNVVDDKNVRDSSDLNPYSTLVENDVVKNKSFSNKLFQKSEHSNYFSVFRLGGKNIWAENENTKVVLIENFARILDSFKYKFSIVKLDEQIDYRRNLNYINTIQSKKMLNSGGETKEFWNSYFKANELDFKNEVKSNLIETFYLILNAPTLEELDECYSTFIQKVEDYEVISYEKLSGFELLSFLNKLNHFNKSEEDIETFLNESDIYESEYSLDRLFKYEKVEFKSNSLKIDDKLYSIKCAGNIPIRLNNEWLKKLFDVSGTVVWNNFPYNDPNVVNKIIDKANKKNMDAGNLDNSIINRFGSALEEESIAVMIDQIQADNFKLFDSNIFVLAEAENAEELKQNNLKIKNGFTRSNFGINDLTFRQFEGFLDMSNYPLSKLDREYYQITSINNAIGYPLKNLPLNDGNNLLLGNEVGGNDSPIVWNMFSLTSSRANHNVMILGTSGMGKSTLTKKILTSSLAAGNIAIIIDPQAEYVKWANKMGGQIVDLGSGDGTVINPLQVKSFIAREEDDANVNFNTLINNHLLWLEKFFSFIFDDMNEMKKNILQLEIIKLYQSWGIYKLKEVKELKNYEWPTMDDLIKQMKKFVAPKDHHDKEGYTKKVLDMAELLEGKFGRYGTLGALYNGHTNINIENDLVVFKTSNLIDTEGSVNARIGIMVLISLVNGFIFDNAFNNKKRINEYKEKNKIRLISKKEIQKLTRYCSFCIDEEHLYISEKNITTLNYISDTTKLVRKLDCGTIHTTQNPSDYASSTAVEQIAKKITGNCQYSFFLGLVGDDIEAVKKLYKTAEAPLLDSEVKFISGRRVGKALASMSNALRYKINLHYNPKEKELFFEKGEDENTRN